MSEFYGFNPQFGIGQRVYVKLNTGVNIGRVTAITFELLDEELLEVTMYYEVEIDGLGGIYCVDESCLKPVNIFLPTIAPPPSPVEVDYSEYTTDELLDAYNAFKSVPGFDCVVKKIEDELKRR